MTCRSPARARITAWDERLPPGPSRGDWECAQAPCSFDTLTAGAGWITLPLLAFEEVRMQLTALPIPYVMTRDLGVALPFWRDVLGFAVEVEGGTSVTLAHGPMRIGLVMDGSHQSSPHPVMGLPVADIEGASQGLAAKGVVFLNYPGLTEGTWKIWTSPPRGGFVKRMNWFSDPEGTVLGLVEVRRVG